MPKMLKDIIEFALRPYRRQCCDCSTVFQGPHTLRQHFHLACRERLLPSSFVLGWIVPSLQFAQSSPKRDEQLITWPAKAEDRIAPDSTLNRGHFVDIEIESPLANAKDKLILGWFFIPAYYRFCVAL